MLTVKLRLVLKIETMTTFRTIVFWTHLACGVAAGMGILIMSVTGPELLMTRLSPSART